MQIVKVPGINGLGKTKGCENAGNVILEKLKDIYSNEQGFSVEVDKLDLEEIHVDNGNVVEANKLIYENAFEVFNEKERVFFLGGDHSVSYSLTRAFFDYCENSNDGKKPCLIVFDAHPDLMEPVDGKIPTHEEWLRALIDDGFPVQNILLVGNRNSWKTELDFIRDKKIRSVSIDTLNLDLEDTTDVIMEFANGKELYVSLDIDVVDPAFAPATGYLEAGGLSSRDIVYIMKRISKMKNLKALDIVELNAIKDKKTNCLSSILAGKILAEFVR